MARKRAGKGKRMETKPKDTLVNAFTARHGDYREADFVDNEGGRMRIHKVFLNRGGSAVDRWINEQDSKLFGRPEIEAVRHCRTLWARIDYHASITNSTGIPSTGQSEQDARDELYDYQKRLPAKLWSCFENVVRWEMPAGTAGSGMANNSRTAVEAAKVSTAFVASMVAVWRGL